jgi:uncharacterized protein (DUF1501 family)
MITRRDFLASGIVAAGSSLIVPPVLARSVFAAGADGMQNDRVLVILQMAGGNDGLNTVVPFGDPAYHAARPTLGLEDSQVLPLNADTGLHPSMKNLQRMFAAGQLAVVQGVGYPQPTYSHFEGMYVWQHADPTRSRTDGWMGSLLAAQLDSGGHPLTGCALHETATPPEMNAQGAVVSVIDSVDAYRVRGDAGQRAAAPALYQRTPGAYGVLLDQALATAESGITALQQTASTYRPAVSYPSETDGGSLSAALQLTASLIATQPTVKVCHVVLGGFDTHQDEHNRQATLLSQLDSSLRAFMADITAHGQAGRVVLMTWSEFGRRIAENGSGGTDHGAAAPLFVLGAPVRGGLYGEPPSLTSTIDSGNLKYTVDFRSVYQTMIRDWLQADPSGVLGGSFPEVSLLKV